MTKYAEKFLEGENIIGFLKLVKQVPGGGTAGTGPHIVELLRDEEGTNKDFRSGKDVDGLWFFFEEDGKEYKYFVPYKNDKGEVHYLISRLAERKEGEDIVLEYTRAHGSPTGYINVRDVTDEDRDGDTQNENDKPSTKKIEDEEIPVIEPY